jgi:hypothetical protein
VSSALESREMLNRALASSVTYSQPAGGKEPLLGMTRCNAEFRTTKKGREIGYKKTDTMLSDTE